MFRTHRSRPWPADVDLSSARETLAYLEDDMSRVPGLEKVVQAIRLAMSEIETAERSAPYPVAHTPQASRFIPWRQS